MQLYGFRIHKKHKICSPANTNRMWEKQSNYRPNVSIWGPHWRNSIQIPWNIVHWMSLWRVIWERDEIFLFGRKYWYNRGAGWFESRASIRGGKQATTTTRTLYCDILYCNSSKSSHGRSSNSLEKSSILQLGLLLQVAVIVLDAASALFVCWSTFTITDP